MTTIANVADQATVAFSSEESSQKQTALAGRTAGVWAAASYSVWRWYRRTRIKLAFRRMSDRILLDLGFEPEFGLNDQINARLDALWVERQRRARVYRELMAYSDAELDDIGIKRVDIPAVARGDCPLEFKAANPLTTATQPASAANDRHHLAAA